MQLSSQSVHERPIVHSARVTNRPRPACAAAVTPVPDPDESTSPPSVTVASASTPLAADAESSPAEEPAQWERKDTGPTPAEDTSMPLPAAELAAQTLQDATWKLETTEHLLYADRPITLAPRAVTTTYLRAPTDLVEHHTTCFVDRLPDRSGLDQMSLTQSCLTTTGQTVQRLGMLMW